MAILHSFQHQGIDAIRVGRFNLGINTSFIVYRFGDTVIDTGPTNQWRYVKPFIQAQPFSQLLLTHHHEDHSGNANRIHQLTGVRPLATQQTIDILRRGFRIPPMQKLIWGSPHTADPEPLPDHLSIAGEHTLALFTPGHARDMTCYLMRDRGWLFSADLYIASNLKMLRSDESLPILLDSIRFTLSHEFDTILCPHRGVVAEGRTKLREKYNNLLTLSDKAQFLQQQGLPPKEISARLLGQKDMMALLTRGNFCKLNLIKSSLSVDLSAHV